MLTCCFPSLVPHSLLFSVFFQILTHFPVVQTEDVLNIVADQIKLSAKANKQVSGDTHASALFFFFPSLFSPPSSLSSPLKQITRVLLFMAASTDGRAHSSTCIR